MARLQELSHLAKSLNEETDAFTNTLASLEKELKSYNLGVEAWVPLSETSKSGTPTRESSVRVLLGYAKLNEGWGFAIKQVRVERGYYQGDLDCPWESEYEEEEPKPLLKSSRDVRLQSATAIDSLLLEINRQGTKLLKAIRAADPTD